MPFVILALLGLFREPSWLISGRFWTSKWAQNLSKVVKMRFQFGIKFGFVFVQKSDPKAWQLAQKAPAFFILKQKIAKILTPGASFLGSIFGVHFG